MPKRVLDFDALWASDKLAACADWAQAEYAWLYGLADASGSFELTNLRVIWGRVAAIRKNLTIEQLEAVFAEFIARGLLFTWEENGKRYGHWTGSDVPGRLPAPSWRARLERLAPPVPHEALAAYAARFASRRPIAHAKDAIACAAFDATRGIPAGALSCADDRSRSNAPSEIKLALEAPPAEDMDLSLDLERKERKTVPRESSSVSASEVSGEPRSQTDMRCLAEPTVDASHSEPATAGEAAAKMLEIYEAERGLLPEAGLLTHTRQRRCAQRLAAGLTLDAFRDAVRRAAATPFLAGAGERGWRASFDWLIANEANLRKVLAGCYEAFASRADGAATDPGARSDARSARERRIVAELYAGTGPPAEGARVKPAALERMRAREAARCVAAGAGAAPQTVLREAGSAGAACEKPQREEPVRQEKAS